MKSDGRLDSFDMQSEWTEKGVFKDYNYNVQINVIRILGAPGRHESRESIIWDGLYKKNYPINECNLCKESVPRYSYMAVHHLY